VHSLFYADFLEDPMTWALLGLVGLVSRVPKKVAPSVTVAPTAESPPVTEPAPSPTPTA
jgi:hypothetical protein